MTKLKDLFDKRDFSYNFLSQEILNKLNSTVLDAVCAVLNVDPKSMIWEDVQLIDEIVSLVAFVVYNIGDIVTTAAGDQVVITADNVDVYKRIVRIGVPLNLAETGTVKDIIAFLKNTKTTSKHVAPVELEQKTDFDANNLTSEQMKQLNLTLATLPIGKGKKH